MEYIYITVIGTIAIAAALSITLSVFYWVGLLTFKIAKYKPNQGPDFWIIEDSPWFGEDTIWVLIIGFVVFLLITIVAMLTYGVGLEVLKLWN